MITINLKQKTNINGHLVIDVPTTLIDKNVDVVLIIQEKEELSPKDSGERKAKKKMISPICIENWSGRVML